ncbi:hypothetical protein B296_00017524 [Ensete ventricosum]|uniref:Endoglucanase n=1 Tax=Ensete ventricosum TaxID=4639 RepID=A0A426Z5M2_ENSVE|nr:hypothetical protein B296_00017524 [Ensete ventricosum]
MDTARTVYYVSADRPGSEVAGETAAALAAASMVFRQTDPAYSRKLLKKAMRVFEFADTHKGAYSDDPGLKAGVCPFYLLSLESYKEFADSFMCTLVPESSSSHIQFTPGGLIYKPGGSNMQHVTSISFLLLAYAKYLSKSSQTVNCGSIQVAPSSLQLQAKKQVPKPDALPCPPVLSATPRSPYLTSSSQIDYMLGDNPMNMSYMVGYGDRYPQRVHHRGSSLPSISSHPRFIACKDGTDYYRSPNPNLNPHVGAVVGGPADDDLYEDDRADFRKSEPTTYINAPLVGALAFFVANPNAGLVLR